MVQSKRSRKVVPSPSQKPQHHSNTPTTKTSFSSAHKVKDFADDLTVLYSSECEHGNILSDINDKCKDIISLEIRADKCVSLVFDGCKMKKKAVFRVGDGFTRNITEGATKFLGRWLDTSPQTTRREAGKILLESFREKLSMQSR